MQNMYEKNITHPDIMNYEQYCQRYRHMQSKNVVLEFYFLNRVELVRLGRKTGNKNKVNREIARKNK